MIKTAMIWLWLCNCGYVIDMQQKHHGHKLYEFYMPEGKRVRYRLQKGNCKIHQKERLGIHGEDLQKRVLGFRSD